MAEKEIALRIKINNKDVKMTSKDVEMLTKNIDDLKSQLELLGERTEDNAEQFDKLQGDIEELDSTFKSTKDSVEDMSESLEESTVQTVSYARELRKTREQLAALGERTEENGAQYDILSNKMIELSDKQEDLQFGTMKLDDAIGGLPGPIGKAGQSFKAFDMFMKQARGSMTALTRTFPILQKAMIASGIGAFVVIIGLLVAALIKAYERSKPLQDAVERLGFVFKIFGDILNPIIDFIGRVAVVAVDALAKSIAFLTGNLDEFNKKAAEQESLNNMTQGLKEMSETIEFLGDTFEDTQRKMIELSQEYLEKKKEIIQDELISDEERTRLLLLNEERFQRRVNRVQQEESQRRLNEERRINEQRIKEEKRIQDERLVLTKQYNNLLIGLDERYKKLIAKNAGELSQLELDEIKKRYESELELIRNTSKTKEEFDIAFMKSQMSRNEEIRQFMEKTNDEIEKSYLDMTMEMSDSASLILNIEEMLMEDRIDLWFQTNKSQMEFLREHTDNVFWTLEDIEQLELEYHEKREKNEDDFMHKRAELMLKNFKTEIELLDERLKLYDDDLLSQEIYTMETANKYDKLSKFGDIFLGRLSKRMSEEMALRFEDLQDLRSHYEERLDDVKQYYASESRFIGQLRADDLISEKEYVERKGELNDLLLQERQRYVRQQIQLDQLEIDSKRVLFDQTVNIAQNLASALSSIFSKSLEAQIASALLEAGVSIARVIIDTQRAIIAFTASVAPLGPAGIPLAAAYATKSKIMAGLAIGTITAQGIGKLKGLKGQTSNIESSGGSDDTRLGRYYERGGIIEGKRHSRGGEIIEAEQGEFIVNRQSTQMFKPLLSALNSMGNGVPISPSVIMNNDNPVNNQQPEMIIKTYVVDSELTNAQERSSRLKNLSTL